MESVIKGNDYTVTILGVPQTGKEAAMHTEKKMGTEQEPGQAAGQKQEVLPVIWLHALNSQEGRAVFEQLHSRCVLVCVECADWNGELSPWPAPAVSRKTGAFAGRAGKHLKQLEEEILPRTEASLPFPVLCRGLAGYSMAGLFAAYAMYHTDQFRLLLV